jgi:NitT/TauT family transport system substrate-binding protein
MKIAIPDLISNSYFPVVAAVELGAFCEEGIDMQLEMIFPVDRTMEVLRDGGIDFVGGSAHSVPAAFPGWKGGKLLAAQAQNMYWFLVLRKDLAAKKGDLNAIKGLRIGAAPLVRLGLEGMLRAGGIDLVRDNVQIVPIPGEFLDEKKSFGVAAARALQAGMIDGFWANGMGAEVAVTNGVGDIVIDARRGDGPAGIMDYTMSALITSDAVIERNPEAVAGAVRALVRTQRKLIADPGLATVAAQRYFPKEETALIAELIRRDAAFLTPTISRSFVAGMLDFQRTVGLLETAATPSYEEVVATQFSGHWELP